MDKKVKIGIGIAAGTVAGFLLYKSVGGALKLAETADNVKVSLLNLPKIHKIDLSGLKIAVDLKVDNPAKGSLTLKIPSIRAYYTPFNSTNRSLIASTAVSNKSYTVNPVSSGKISGIMIEATYIDLLKTAPTIVGDFLAQGTKIIDRIGFDVIAEVNGIPLKVQKL